MCVICKPKAETIKDLLMDYSFVKKVCKEVFNLVGCVGIQEWDTIVEGFKKWAEFLALSNCKALASVVSWDIQITRNRILFQDQSYSLVRVFHNIKYIYGDFILSPNIRDPTNIDPLEINKSFLGGFFMDLVKVILIHVVQRGS